MDAEQITYDYGIDDLDHDEITRVVQKGVELGRLPREALDETIPEVLARLGLLDDGCLKNAAVILFVKGHRHLAKQLNIMMARFMGLDIVDKITDNQAFYGNVFRILSEASHYAGRYLAMPEFLDAGDPIPEGPPRLSARAFREALINAIIHRDYSYRSSSLYFAIYNDRIEITSPGDLPAELSISSLPDNQQSYPQNDLIANAFHIYGLTDRQGKGISKMFDACHEEGFPLPEFLENARGFYVILKFKEALGPIESPPHSPLRYPNNQWG